MDPNKFELTVTDEGKATIFKQGTGFKFANIGFALVKDSRDHLASARYAGKLSELSTEWILNNCTVILKNTVYKYTNGAIVSNDSRYAYNVTEKLDEHLYPLDFTLSKDDEETDLLYTSYNALIKPDMFNITNVTGDMQFDAILLFALPFKPEYKNRLEGDPQKPLVFAIAYYPNKLKVLKNQSENLVFNAEIRYEMETDGEVVIDNLDHIHIVNDGTASKKMPNVITLGTTDNLLIV